MNLANHNAKGGLDMIRYPMGQNPHRQPAIKALRTSQTQYGSRGMSLEERINQSNQYYLANQLAVIHKKPTPIQVVKVDYPKRSAARITEAYYRQASTTDYNGVYQGHYLDFEAKETQNKQSFPLSNLKDHQVQHMKACHDQGGLVFLLVSFKKLDQVYLLSYPALAAYLKANAKQSIPISYFDQAAYRCPTGALPMIDYLQAVDQFLAELD